MKRLLLGTAICAAGGMTALSATAQDMFRAGGEPGILRASDFIGQRIHATETAVTGGGIAGVQEGWNDIGEVNDILLTRDGQVSAVLVDIGGFLGMGERQVAIRPGALYFVDDTSTPDDTGDYLLVVTAGRGTLEAAPPYDHMGTANTGTQGMSGDASGATADATAPLSGNNAGATADANAQADLQAIENAPGSAEGGISDRETAAASGTEGAQGSEAGGGMTGMQAEGYASADSTMLTTEEMEGVRVSGADGEDLGEISSFVLSEDGRISQVIVDIGGFLGIGAKPVAIDLASLQVMRAENGNDLRAFLPMTRDQLDAMPRAE